jgi:hypothetical protein
VNISETDLQECEALFKAATQAPVELGISPEFIDTPEKLAEMCRLMFARGKEMRVWQAYTGDVDDALVVAMTGNGPTSEANARFITLAFRAWPKLIQEIRDQRALLSAKTDGNKYAGARHG